VDASIAGSYSASSSSDTQPFASGTAVGVRNQTSQADGCVFLGLSPRNASGALNHTYIGAVTGSGTSSSIVFGGRTGATAYAEHMRIDSSGNVIVGGTAQQGSAKLSVVRSTAGEVIRWTDLATGGAIATVENVGQNFIYNGALLFSNGATERARIASGGSFMVGKSARNFNTTGLEVVPTGDSHWVADGQGIVAFNRLTNDGVLVEFAQAGTVEGNISVSGSTVSYNAFCGGHWTQLQEGRGYNPVIPRGTIMSSIGEMAVWKSVEWTETVEHPAIEAVEAVEAVLDEDGNVLEPAVEAVEGKEAWTETFNKREAYLGNLDIGATFEEDGFTKTVVDDGNERLPKVKISDVVGDKAVYGVFQTWDDVEDMLITSLGAFVVRIAAGVTVEIGDLLESNGDGCAKVQDDDVIRSKTIGKVTSTVATATYDDGSYTVPCVLYCG
jgi:hypothetical protein